MCCAALRTIGGVGQTRQSDTLNIFEDVATPFLTADTPMHMQGSETPMQFAGESTPFIGGETPRGQSDDIWKVNEGDKERLSNLPANTGAGGAYIPQQFNLTHEVWDVRFIMQIIDGQDSGRHGVLRSRIGSSGYGEISLIAAAGNLEEAQTKYHHTALIPAEIKNGATVTILHGDPRVIGFTGRCTWLSDVDVIIDVEGGTHMAKRAHCAVVYIDN